MVTEFLQAIESEFTTIYVVTGIFSVHSFNSPVGVTGKFLYGLGVVIKAGG